MHKALPGGPMPQPVFRLIARVTSALALLAAVVLTTGALAPAPALSTVAYQGTIATAASITNPPNAPFGTCVQVHVSVNSDAGTPQGTVEFSVDGVVVDRRAVPSSGTFVEMLGCCGSKLSKPLSVGTHHFAVNFIPTGNWAPSHATGQVVIQPPASGATVPTCGTIPTGGLPHGVDAGLAGFGAQSSGISSTSSLLRAAATGLALGLGITAIIGYRRRMNA